MAQHFAPHPPPSPNINHARCLEKSLRLPRSHPKVAEWLFSEAHLPYHRNAPLLSPTAFAASRTVKLRYAFFNVATSNFDVFGIEDGPQAVQHPAHSRRPAAHHFPDVNRANHQHPSAAAADEPLPKSHSIMRAELLLTPVTRAAPSIIVGYAMLMGSLFDPSAFGAQTGSARGKAHFNGRYAYDVDNNHIIVVINAVTEHHTLIVDLTFAGVSRERYYYSVPCRAYSHGDLPTRVLSLFSSVEVRVPPTNQYTSPAHWHASNTPNNSNNSNKNGHNNSTASGGSGGVYATPDSATPMAGIMADVNAMRGIDPRLLTSKHAARTDDLLTILGDSSLAAEVSRGAATPTWKDTFALASDMRILVQAMTGHFKSARFTRDMFDLENPSVVVSRVNGSMAGSMGAPEPRSHRHAVVYGWQEYSASACALQTERILGGNLLAGDMGMGLAEIGNGDGDVDGDGDAGMGDGLFGGVGAGAGDMDRGRSWVCQDHECGTTVGDALGRRYGASGGTSSSTGDRKDGNTTAVGGSGDGGTVVEEMAADDERVRDMRTCQTCKGLIGRKGVTLVDEETMRREKLEAKKRKNRLSAARSNQRRKEREEQQRAELSERVQMVRDLTARRDALRAENALLRANAAARGLL